MEYIELKMSLNTTGETSSENPAIRFARSKFGATMLLFVSLLWPFESFSQNCTLNAAPICLDATPCKSLVDSGGNNVTTCLSSAVAPVGALVTTKSCWQYSASYNCMNQASPTYNDTCKQVQTDGSCASYAETSVTCNPSMPLLSGGACPLFDVTYTCQIAPGTPYTVTTCGSNTACKDANGNPTFCTGPVPKEQNGAFANVVAGAETARQAGVYLDSGVNPGETDLTKLAIFKGEFNRCSEGMWGGAPNCCKQNGMGASASNALIAQELVGNAWNALDTVIGTGYAYDSLLMKTIDMLSKGIDAMRAVYEGLQYSSNIATTLANAGSILTGAGAQASGSGTLSTSAMAGGAIGGYIGGQAGSYIANNNGANTGFAGTLSALGSAAGTYVGTYAGAYASAYIASFVSSVAGGAGVGAAAATAGAAGSTAGTSALGTLGWVGLVIMVVVMIIMAFAACAPEDYQTMVKLGAPGLCHYNGTYCNTHDFLGGCITTMQSYCCFNSRLARLVQEGAKQQIPTLTWGTPEFPDCAGMKIADLQNVDFSKIDLSEFVQDVTTRVQPTVAAAATRVQNVTTGFMAANNFDPTATNGQLITSGAQLPALAPITPGTPNSAPPMMPCTYTSQITGILPDGTETKTFSVSQCNVGATIVWSNVGNCASSPVTSMDPASPNFASSLVDSSGNATFVVTLPPACFATATPPIQNFWKGNVTLQPYGTLGVINANW